MSDLMVCFMSSLPDRHQERYMSDLKERGFGVIWEQVDDFRFRKKVDWIGRVASEHPYTWLVFTDAYDFVLLAESPEEVVRTLESLGPGPIFQADSACWPLPVGDRYDAIQKGTGAASSYWRFVNGCGPSGKGWAIASAVAHLKEHHPVTSDLMSDLEGNDQRAWTETYLDGIGVVDFECRLIQSVFMLPEAGIEWDGKRVHNRVTGSTPCFAHLCGHSDNAWHGLKGKHEANFQGEVCSVHRGQ